MANLTLTPADVASHVEWLTFMPGWTFVGMPNYYGSDDYINVRIVRQQPDSDYPPMYTKAMEWQRDVIIDLRTVESIDDVNYRIVTACIEWMNDGVSNEHEAREFFRVNESRDPIGTGPATWKAPFHPHRVSGHRAWNARSGVPSQGC